MSEPKTRKTRASVEEFLDAIPDAQQRADAKLVDRLMREISGDRPALWGPNIVGYGSHTLTYANGKTADWPVVAFSPRKQALTLYLEVGFAQREALLARLGKHSTGKSCLYVKKLADVDPEVLRALVAASVEHTRTRPAGKG
jgi:hypothetical protein